MPTTGEAGYRYPTPGAIPDVPLDLQKLAQDVARVTDSVATVADLPAAGNWAGRTKIVRSTPGAYWQWTGAEWNMYGMARFANEAARTAAIPAPKLGMESILEDIGREFRHTGSTWALASTIGPWIAYNATLTGFATGTGGAAKNSTLYRYEGDLIRVRYAFVFGTSGFTYPTNPAFSLPVQAEPLAYDYVPYNGDSGMFDVSATSIRAKGGVLANGTSRTSVLIFYPTSNGLYAYPTISAPFAWGIGDSMSGEFTYRPA